MLWFCGGNRGCYTIQLLLLSCPSAPRILGESLHPSHLPTSSYLPVPLKQCFIKMTTVSSYFLLLDSANYSPKSKHSPYFVQQIHLILGFIACNFDQMCSKQIKQIIKIKRSFGKKSLSVPPSRQLYLNQCVIC
jgi:hypothetical protein